MSHERRSSFRFPLSEDLRDAVIEARAQRLPVELLDQSADGFSVKAPRDIEIALDEVIVIETWAGHCQAVVARLADCRDYRRIGLRRISDITPCSRRSLWFGAWLRARLPRQQDERGRKNLAWAIAAIAATMLVAIGWMFKPAATPATPTSARLAGESGIDDGAIAVDSENDPADEGGVALQSATLATAITTASDSPTPHQALAALTPNAGAPSATDGKPPAANADRPPQAALDRLTALRTPKMANDLALSEQQKLEISRLLKKVSAEVSRVNTRLGGKSRAARDAKLGAILVEAEAQANAILNPEQQARWQSE